MIRRLGDPLRIKMHRWRVMNTRHRKNKTNKVQERKEMFP